MTAAASQPSRRRNGLSLGFGRSGPAAAPSRPPSLGRNECCLDRQFSRSTPAICGSEGRPPRGLQHTCLFNYVAAHTQCAQGLLLDTTIQWRSGRHGPTEGTKGHERLYAKRTNSLNKLDGTPEERTHGGRGGLAVAMVAMQAAVKAGAWRPGPSGSSGHTRELVLSRKQGRAPLALRSGRFSPQALVSAVTNADCGETNRPFTGERPGDRGLRATRHPLLPGQRESRRQEGGPARTRWQRAVWAGGTGALGDSSANFKHARAPRGPLCPQNTRTHAPTRERTRPSRLSVVANACFLHTAEEHRWQMGATGRGWDGGEGASWAEAAGVPCGVPGAAENRHGGQWARRRPRAFGDEQPGGTGVCKRGVPSTLPLSREETEGVPPSGWAAEGTLDRTLQGGGDGAPRGHQRTRHARATPGPGNGSRDRGVAGTRGPTPDRPGANVTAGMQSRGGARSWARPGSAPEPLAEAACLQPSRGQSAR